jgi:hypothetical protein
VGGELRQTPHLNGAAAVGAHENRVELIGHESDKRVLIAMAQGLVQVDDGGLAGLEARHGSPHEQPAVGCRGDERHERRRDRGQPADALHSTGIDEIRV